MQEDGLQREVDFHKEKELEQKDMMKLKVIEFSKTLRPSLIQIAKTRTGLKYGKLVSTPKPDTTIKDEVVLGQNSFEGFYTFHGFSTSMRFPPSFSPHMQKRAYWLASQTAFAWQPYVPDFLPKDLAGGLLQYGSIATPEEQIVYEAIASTSITGNLMNPACYLS